MLYCISTFAPRVHYIGDKVGNSVICFEFPAVEESHWSEVDRGE